MYFHKPQEKPCRWGSFQDVQYAIRKNAEKIYQIDPDSMVLCMPLFWGLPPMDYSGYNNHGTNHGAIWKNESLCFDGTNYCHVSVPDGSSINVNGDTQMTILIQLYVNAYLGEGTLGERLLTKSNISYGSGDAYEFGLYTDNHNLVFRISGNTLVEGTQTLDLSTWYNIVFAYDGTQSVGSRGNFYINSVQDNITTDNILSSLPDSTDSLKIGGLYTSPYNRHFNGFIDEVRISNVIHTAEQIALFHALPYGLYQPVSRPVYFFQAAAGLSIPVAMQNMRGGFNPIGTRGGFINAG